MNTFVIVTAHKQYVLSQNFARCAQVTQVLVGKNAKLFPRDGTGCAHANNNWISKTKCIQGHVRLFWHYDLLPVGLSVIEGSVV